MLPKELLPKSQFDLIRLGEDNDGGYLICQNAYKESKFLIGLGINDDWSFEESFQKEFIGFDDQLSFKFLLKKFLMNIIMLRLSKIIPSLLKIKYYLNNRKSFIKKTINSFDNKKFNFISLNSIISNYCNLNRDIFLKVDIEGAEYRILEQIIQNENKLSGLVIEFHNIDLHLDRIKNFINTFSLKLVHIHGNNFSKTNSINDPYTIELTFSRNPKVVDSKYKLPHHFDMPNDPSQEEIKLYFEK